MISSLELAALCGVSQGTVDRALHDRPGISAATKARILALARAHGYQPHPAARELLSGESRLVGAVAPALNSIFFMDLMQAVTQACAAEGLRLLITPVTTRAEFAEALTDFAARRFRAALAVPPQEEIALPAQVTRALPVATLLSPCRGAGTRAFIPDEAATGRRAVDYLVARGHRRILHVTYARPAHSIRARTDGYRAGMRAHALADSVCAAREPAAIRAALAACRPTAIFCHNDWLALAVIRLLAEDGLRVPADISVLGVDNSPTFTNLYPGITTLAYPTDAVARAALAWALHGTVPAALPALEVVERESVQGIG